MSADELRCRRPDVDDLGQGIGPSTGRCVTRPSDDEGLAVPAVPDVGLEAAPIAAALVAVGIAVHVARARAIVTGDEQQRVVGDAQMVEGVEHLADHVIDDGDHVAAQSGLAGADEALWRARIHPLRPSNSLSAASLDR